MQVIIIKYNAGNIRSVLYALERIGVVAVVSDDHDTIRAADRVIFPGVGEASSAMRYLKDRGLDRVVADLTQPVLGICLGMQLMCRYSEENDTDCLGIFDEQVKLFRPPEDQPLETEKEQLDEMFVVARPTRHTRKQQRFKVPQIGWNGIYDLKTPLFTGIAENSFCYFVHSYYAAAGAHTIARTDYIQPYSSALRKDNFYGVQFHPEKSAAVGEQLLRNFLNL